MIRTRHRTSGERTATRIAAMLATITLLTTAGSSILFGQTPQARAISNRNGMTSPKQAVALNGTWIHWVKEVSVVQTGRPGGGVNAQVSVKTFVPADSPVARLIAATMAGAAQLTTVQVGTFDSGMQMLDAFRSRARQFRKSISRKPTHPVTGCLPLQ